MVKSPKPSQLFPTPDAYCSATKGRHAWPAISAFLYASVSKSGVRFYRTVGSNPTLSASDSDR